MNRNDYKPDSYEKKILELHGKVTAEAKNLQDVLDSKMTLQRECSEQAERKARLFRELNSLEAKVKEKEEYLNEFTQKKYTVIESTKRELNKEKESLKETKKLSVKLSEQVNNLLPVVKEFQDFVAKEADARLRYLEEKKKLNASEKKHTKIMSEIENERKLIAEENKSLDGIKTYLTDFYGKIATYTRVAKETIEQVNEALENKVPLYFELPPGEKEIKVEFSNFSKFI